MHAGASRTGVMEVTMTSNRSDESRVRHRYLVERTFPPGALDGLDAAAKAQVNANNASLGVVWVTSYANADKTRTFCVYEGASEKAVREAAELNHIPVDRVTEIPIDLVPR
jgi:Protein of unknown function (DUF4242)